MKIEVLVSTMNQKDFSIVTRMNLKTDSLIINQADYNAYVEKKINNKTIKMFSFNERGVGLSRNNALMRSTGDICLMADDDMVYVDNYENKVINAFKNNPKADMIMFNVPIHKENSETVVKVKKNGRVRLYNALKYGTVNIAFKKEVITKKNLFFTLLFGGGTHYGSGEDSLFIVESLRKRLKIYSCSEMIAEIEENKSTWFEGYNEKYFFDRGALFQAIAGTPLSFLLMIQFLIRKRNLYSDQLTQCTALKQMVKGRNDFLNISKLD